MLRLTPTEADLGAKVLANSLPALNQPPEVAIPSVMIRAGVPKDQWPSADNAERVFATVSTVTAKGPGGKFW
jgi:hypothetical protein